MINSNSNTRHLPGWIHRNYLYLCGVTAGITITLPLSGAFPAALLLLAAAGYLSYRRLWRETAILLVSAMIGASSVIIQHQSKPFLRNRHFEDLAVRITDNNAVGPRWHASEPEPDRVIANAEIDGTLFNIQLYFPGRCPNPGVTDQFHYQISGNFYQNDQPIDWMTATSDGKWRNVSKAFRRSSYADYLHRHNIHGTLVVESIKPVAEQKLSLMNKIRLYAAQKLDNQLTVPAHRAILGAVTLGLRYRLIPAVKREYAQIGLAHLFSISGLHIGILAGLLLLAVRPFPAVWHWIVVSTLAGYVVLTGGNAPAIRAFLMVLTIEIFRSAMLKIRPLELLSLICTVLLIINPYYIADAGFQYSFVVTAILIMTAPAARDAVYTFAGVPYQLAPLSKFRKNLLKIRGRAAGTILFALSAAAASSILTLYWQQIYFSGSVVVNLLALPVLMPLFVLALLKLALPASWCILCNWALKLCVDYLNWICSTFVSDAPLASIARPHWLLVFIYIVLLAMLIKFAAHRMNKYAVAALAGLLLCITLILTGRSSAPDKAAVVITGGDISEPVAALMLPQAGTMYLANAPRAAASPLVDTAAHYGINRINRLDFSRPVIANASGVKMLLSSFPVEKSRIPATTIPSRKFQKIAAALNAEKGAIPGELSTPGGDTIKLQKQPDGTLQVRFNGKLFSIPHTSRERVYILKER